MKKYEYPNAIIYITDPTEKHVRNIRNATENFMRKLAARGVDIGGRDIDGD